MSRPDKTVISIQRGKTTEQQVRFQDEKHLRTFIICSQLDSSASKPRFKAGGWSQSQRRARLFEHLGHCLRVMHSFRDFANWDHVLLEL